MKTLLLWLTRLLMTGAESILFMNREENPGSQNSQHGHSYSLLSADTVQRDLNNLGLKDSTYNVHLPPDSGGGPIHVEVSISLRNILEIDELRQLITIETTMRLYWQDQRLQVEHLLPENSSDSYILLHPDTSKHLWFPDLYIDFAKALRIASFMVPPASLRIYRNSTLRYATQINYDVACPMNFRKYPYDTQVCRIKYESYGHTTSHMEVKWKRGFDKSDVTENNSISLAQFDYMVRFQEEYIEEIAAGEFPGVIMTIVLRRKIQYHLLQTYLPSGLFVIVAWLSLFLPPESIPGRVAMAMTTLLTLASMFGAVRQNTPRVSYVSALDIWMCICIVFVFFTLLEYVIVIYLIYQKKTPHEKKEPGSEMRRHKKHHGRLCSCWRRKGKAVSINGSADSSSCRHSPTPAEASVPTYMAVENTCIYLMAGLFIVFNGIYWPLLMWEDDLDTAFESDHRHFKHDF